VTTAPKHDQSSNAPASRNIFEDPAIAEAAKNDAFVRFVVRHWRSVLLTLAVVAGSIIAYDIVTTTAEQKRANATARLSEIQDTYQELVKKQGEAETLRADLQKASDQKAKDDLTSKLDADTKEVERLHAKVDLLIGDLNSPKPFDILSGLYKGLVAGRFHDFETTKSMLLADTWEQSGEPGAPERSIAEVAALGLAKTLAEIDEYRTTAKDALRGLASRGSFVAVEAVRALSLLAVTPEEKAEVSALVADVKKRFPKQVKYLEGL
jgi:uncharacterized protein YdbL (DUF1318 family)